MITTRVIPYRGLFDFHGPLISYATRPRKAPVKLALGPGIGMVRHKGIKPAPGAAQELVPITDEASNCLYHRREELVLYGSHQLRYMYHN